MALMHRRLILIKNNNLLVVLYSGVREWQCSDRRKVLLVRQHTGVGNLCSGSVAMDAHRDVDTMKYHTFALH